MADTNFSVKHPKRVIYRKVKGYPGLCTVWDWSEKRNQYVKRQVGLKFYAYRKVNGVQRSRTFESFEEAKKWRDNPDLFSHEEITTGLTFRQLREKFFEHKKSRLRVSTFETYESNSKHLRFFDDLLVSCINPKTIDAWLVQLKNPEYLKLQHRSRLSYRHELSVLRQILIYFAEYLDDSFQVPIKKRHLDDCIVDPIKSLQAKARNKTRFIPRAECDLFLQQMDLFGQKDPKKKVFSALALFQLRTGARVGEIAALKWTDIDLKNGEVSISKTVQWSRRKGRETCISDLTKTGDTRIVPLTSQVLDSLRAWQKLTGRSVGLVFSQDGFSILAYRSIQHHFNKAFEELGLPWRSTHILRHSFATDFLEKTLNQHALQELLGHRSPKQTDHYAKRTKQLTETGLRAYEASFKDSSVVDLDEYKEKLREKNDTPKNNQAGSGWE